MRVYLKLDNEDASNITIDNTSISSVLHPLNTI